MAAYFESVDLPGFAKWFLEEQVEEEDLFSSTLAQVKAVDNKPWHLLMLDKQLGQRED